MKQSILERNIRTQIKFLYRRTLDIMGEYNEQFMLGLFIGVMLISVVFYRFNGITFALSPYGQFHLVSVNIFFILCPASYYLLKFEKDNGKRVLGSIMFPLIAFSLHDIFWLFETHFVTQIYKNGLVLNHTTLPEYAYHYSKNILNLIPSVAVFLKYKYFRINGIFLLSFLVLVIFHMVNIVYGINIYVLNGWALILMETIDVLPFMLLIKRL